MPLPHEGAIRFWKMVDRSGDCWEWQGAKLKGYGQLTMGNRRWLAHRLAWIFTNGEIPDALWVLHKCDNPPCVRPDHLFLGTQFDNMADAASKGRMPGPGLCGENVATAKLTEQDVREIRALHESGMPQRAIARRFRVTRQNVRCIVRRITWKEVS